MFRQCLPPFLEYKSSGPYFSEKEGRMRINLLHKEKSRNRNMIYARYLLSVSRNEEPSKGLEVDHIDGDRTNDMLGNLQVLSRTDNTKKGIQDPMHLALHVFYRFTCLHCGREFTRRRRDSHLCHKSRHATYCSRKCGYYSSSYLDCVQKYEKVPATPVAHKRVCEDWDVYSRGIVISKCTAPPKKSSIKNVFAEKEVSKVCVHCGRLFYPKKKANLFCSRVCFDSSRCKGSIQDKIVLVSRVLRGEVTWVKAGQELGISDSGLRKWAKNNGLLEQDSKHPTKDLNSY